MFMLTSMLQKSEKMDMGDPLGKPSGRTLYRLSTAVSDPCWTSLSVKSYLTLEMSNQPPSEGLESGLPMADYAR
jgi:hypothetical protein